MLFYNKLRKLSLLALFFYSHSIYTNNPWLAMQAQQFLGKGFSITQTHPLNFGDMVAGAPMDVVTLANSPDAAVFTATGDPNQAISVKVTRNRFFLKSTRNNDRILVDSFNYGGDLNAQGTGILRGDGQLLNIRIGATAHMDAFTAAGDYSGEVTVRIISM